VIVQVTCRVTASQERFSVNIKLITTQHVVMLAHLSLKMGYKFSTTQITKYASAIHAYIKAFRTMLIIHRDGVECYDTLGSGTVVRVVRNPQYINLITGYTRFPKLHLSLRINLYTHASRL
jgi:hypothetical protein